MTQDLITQLPLLEGLYRYLEQLSMMEVPNEPQSRPKIHQIPELTSQLLENSDWKEIAKKQEMEFKGESKETVDKMVNELSKVFNTDDLEKFLDDPRCAKCGELAMQRCSRCKSEWYCGRACQVSAWVDHKNICDMMQGMENVKVT